LGLLSSTAGHAAWDEACRLLNGQQEEWKRQEQLHQGGGPSLPALGPAPAAQGPLLAGGQVPLATGAVEQRKAIPWDCTVGDVAGPSSRASAGSSRQNAQQGGREDGEHGAKEGRPPKRHRLGGIPEQAPTSTERGGGGNEAPGSNQDQSSAGEEEQQAGAVWEGDGSAAPGSGDSGREAPSRGGGGGEAPSWGGGGRGVPSRGRGGRGRDGREAAGRRRDQASHPPLAATTQQQPRRRKRDVGVANLLVDRIIQLQTSGHWQNVKPTDSNEKEMGHVVQ